jgi:putative NIF3 family GTP cyclohydrolase 1 type 2
MYFIGHYYSETFGVKALMKTLEKEFKLECNFFDIPTGF